MCWSYWLRLDFMSLGKFCGSSLISRGRVQFANEPKWWEENSATSNMCAERTPSFQELCAVWSPQDSPPAWAPSLSLPACVHTVLGVLETQRWCLPTCSSFHSEQKSEATDQTCIQTNVFHQPSAVGSSSSFLLLLSRVVQQAHNSRGGSRWAHTLREAPQCPQLHRLLPMSSVTPLAVLNHFSLPDGGGRGGE